MSLPTLFVSHGSPMLAIEDSPARRFLLQLGNALPRPKAIIVASAHWESMGGLAVSLASHPETIHDFGGFPEALFDLQYPAQGAPDTAARAANLLEQAGFAVKRDATPAIPISRKRSTPALRGWLRLPGWQRSWGLGGRRGEPDTTDARRRTEP
jgi:aromatic ring-opening dioxygenase catalytic subunit (LigB family)